MGHSPWKERMPSLYFNNKYKIPIQYSDQALLRIPSFWVKHGFSGQNDKDAF